MGYKSINGDNIELVADAIRGRNGKTSTIGFPDAMATAITNLASASTCKNGSVTQESDGKESIVLPVTGLVKLQAIYLFRPEYESTANQNTIDSLFIVFADDGSTIEAVACTGTNTYYVSGGTVFYNLNSTSNIEVVMSTSNITITSNEYDEGCFFGKYYYHVYGI